MDIIDNTSKKIYDVYMTAIWMSKLDMKLCISKGRNCKNPAKMQETGGK